MELEEYFKTPKDKTFTKDEVNELLLEALKLGERLTDYNIEEEKHISKASDLICPLLKEKCIREKCVCYSTRDYDTFGFPSEQYGACEHFKLNLDYEKEGENE